MKGLGVNGETVVPAAVNNGPKFPPINRIKFVFSIGLDKLTSMEEPSITAPFINFMAIRASSLSLK